MAIYDFEGRVPKVAENAYISETADVIGDVTIGSKCFIGPGAKIKGDYGKIIIGNESSVQENCILHARPGEKCVVGKRVNVGHGCILHGCTIMDNAVVGMGAVVSDFAVVGDWAVVGEGAVVRSKQEVPGGTIAVGVPAKVIGEVTDDYKVQWNGFKDVYVGLCERYKKGLRRVK